MYRNSSNVFCFGQINFYTTIYLLKTKYISSKNIRACNTKTDLNLAFSTQNYIVINGNYWFNKLTVAQYDIITEVESYFNIFLEFMYIFIMFSNKKKSYTIKIFNFKNRFPYLWS